MRSLTHPHNDHSAGHHDHADGPVADLPPGFNPQLSRGPATGRRSPPWPGPLTRPRNNLPPAVVLPEKLVHNTGRVIPGQFAGLMGRSTTPGSSRPRRFEPVAYGAYPEYGFDHQERPPAARPDKRFQAPSLSLPEGLGRSRASTDRLDLLDAHRPAAPRPGPGGAQRAVRPPPPGGRLAADRPERPPRRST